MSFSAEPIPSSEGAVTAFQMGGAVSRAALVPDFEAIEDTPRRRLALPSTSPESMADQQEFTFGRTTLFFGERVGLGPDAVQMGTFLSRGSARAGVSVTYLEDDEEITQPEFFLGYALTENFSVGLSSVLNSDLAEEDTVQQFGVSAEYVTDSGTFIQGGFADAAEYEPIIGLSVGLRF